VYDTGETGLLYKALKGILFFPVEDRNRFHAIPTSLFLFQDAAFQHILQSFLTTESDEGGERNTIE
jgi:hypothetical protein